MAELVDAEMYGSLDRKLLMIMLQIRGSLTSKIVDNPEPNFPRNRIEGVETGRSIPKSIY